MALLAALLVLALGTAVIVALVQVRTLELLDGTRRDAQVRRLDALTAALTDYYGRTANVMDADAAAPLDCAGLLAAVAVPQTRDLVEVDRLVCAIGARRMTPDGSLAWRSIWLWLPPEDAVDTSVYDAASDQLQAAPGAIWRQVDGRALQSVRLRRSLDRLDSVARDLLRFYSARAQTALSVDAASNFWALWPCAQASSPAQRDAPACTGGGWVAATAVLPAIGLPVTAGIDAWNRPFEFINSGAGLPTAPPFEARLRMRTPWGFTAERALVANL